MVEYGLLARGEDHRLAAEAAAIRKLLSDEWQLTAEDDDAERSAGTQQTPSRQDDNGADSVSTPAGPTGPKKDQ
jgi:cytochrome c biogenesis protein